MSLTEVDLDLPVSEDELQLNKSWDDDAGSVSDSLELECVACKISSKQGCPIAARRAALGQESLEPSGNRKGEVRVGWGKYTARKLKTRSGRKVKVRRRCGVWCRTCTNILRKLTKRKKYKKNSKAWFKKKMTSMLR